MFGWWPRLLSWLVWRYDWACVTLPRLCRVIYTMAKLKSSLSLGPTPLWLALKPSVLRVTEHGLLDSGLIWLKRIVGRPLRLLRSGTTSSVSLLRMIWLTYSPLWIEILDKRPHRVVSPVRATEGWHRRCVSAFPFLGR